MSKVILVVICSLLWTEMYAQCPTLMVEGRTYRTVQIGKACWMAQNLNIKVSESWCYNDDDDYCRRYGALYTWNAAKAAAQKVPGWHLPNDQDWRTLDKNLRKEVESNDRYGFGFTRDPLEAFNISLGGYRSTSGNYYGVGSDGSFWSSSSPGRSFAWKKYAGRYEEKLSERYGDRSQGFSVRLIKK